ncbi:uncharacterized protein [Ptychodera flava]|uniref:uncharacterized protein n=1 Tax=Ptychodera flava TaxID=63121 RepID=UPI00396A7C73
MASRSVLVTGIPRREGGNVDRMKDQITIYFQKKSNGGGDVDLVLFPLSSKRKDAAMVFFNDKAVIDTVLKRKHRLFESEVKVQLKPPEPFSNVRAVISAEMLDLIGEQEEFFENLSAKTGITSHTENTKEGKAFIVEGGYYQFQNVQRFFEKYIDDKIEDEGKQSRRSAGQSKDKAEHTGKDVQLKYPPDEKFTPSSHDVPETLTSQAWNTSQLNPQAKSTDGNPEKMKLGIQIPCDRESQKQDEAATRCGLIEPGVREDEKTDDSDESSYVLRVNPDIFAFVKHVHNHQFSEIKSTHRIKVSQKPHDKESLVRLYPNDPSAHSKDNLEKAQSAITKLYQDSVVDLCQRKMNVAASESELTKAGAEVVMKHPKVYVKMQSNEMVFYGKERDIENAKSTLRRALGLLDREDNDNANEMGRKFDFDDKASTENPSNEPNVPRGRRHARRDPTSPTYNNNLSSGYRRERGMEYNDRCQFTLNDISIQVYRGDITHENTDVIVNAANEDLDHIGGLAAAISDAAGYQLQSECKDILYRRNYQPLAASEIVPSRAYTLPCKHVIHAVGPRWYRFKDKSYCISLLKETFQNCLSCADRDLKVRSIAIPTVSSGIFGVPKPVCAQALFDAVTEFCSSQTSNGILKEIRLVNIDHESTEEILKIFKGQRPPTARHQDEMRRSAGLEDADFRAPRERWESPDRGKGRTYLAEISDDDSYDSDL